MKAARFDWDSGNWPKCGRHGVSREEIEQLFLEGCAISPDLRHSSDETRLIAVGRNRMSRPMFVAFTMRRSDEGPVIRPVSARYMHEKEARRYGS